MTWYILNIQNILCFEFHENIKVGIFHLSQGLTTKIRKQALVALIWNIKIRKQIERKVCFFFKMLLIIANKAHFIYITFHPFSQKAKKAFKVRKCVREFLMVSHFLFVHNPIFSTGLQWTITEKGFSSLSLFFLLLKQKQAKQNNDRGRGLARLLRYFLFYSFRNEMKLLLSLKNCIGSIAFVISSNNINP